MKRLPKDRFTRKFYKHSSLLYDNGWEIITYVNKPYYVELFLQACSCCEEYPNPLYLLLPQLSYFLVSRNIKYQSQSHRVLHSELDSGGFCSTIWQVCPQDRIRHVVTLDAEEASLYHLELFSCEN